MSHGKRETPQLAPGACLRARVDLVPVTHFSTPAQRRALFLDRRYLQGRVSASVASVPEPAWSPVGAFMTSHAATPEPMTDDQRLGTFHSQTDSFTELFGQRASASDRVPTLLVLDCG
jgi:hypothetical protein